MMAEGIRAVQESVRREIERIWLDEPEDVAALRRGFVPSGAGAYGQYFSVLVMLGGEVRGLAVHSFSNLLAFSRSGRFDLAQLKEMTREMLRVAAGVVGYFGLRRFGGLLGGFLAHLDEVDHVDQLTPLFEDLFTLSNRYQMWLHQTFPWRLAVFFPKRTPAQAEAELETARRCFAPEP
jgi:hypothetical protein